MVVVKEVRGSQTPNHIHVQNFRNSNFKCCNWELEVREDQCLAAEMSINSSVTFASAMFNTLKVTEAQHLVTKMSRTALTTPSAKVYIK